MAGTALNKRDDAMSDGATRATRVEYNKLVADVDAAITTINEIITAAATNIAAVAAVTPAAAATAALVKDQNGVAT